MRSLSRVGSLAVLLSLVVVAVTATGWAFGQGEGSALDFGQAADWTPGPPPPREKKTQLMMIDVLDVDVPALRADRDEAVPPTVQGFWAKVWGALAQPTRFLSIITTVRRQGLWLYPLGRGDGQGVTRATRVHAYITSLGTSTGEAFDIQIVNDGTAPVRIGGDGIVVEPIKKGSEKRLRAELQEVAARGSGTASFRANAYCLEFKLDPPTQGTMFRVVDSATQQQYRPAREILRASRRLQASGELMPDSDPAEYFHAIRQWAIWVNEQRFTLPTYANAFVERTKKNAKALGVKWSKDLETSLRAAAPHRWDEIVRILGAAGLRVPGA